MASKHRPIKDQVIVIGDAATPVGLAVATAAGRRGARLMLVGADEAALGEAARAVNNAGGRADFAVAGAADVKALEAAAVAAVKRFGRIDSWIEAGPPAAWRDAARAVRGRGRALAVIAGEAAEIDRLRAELAPGIVLGSVDAGDHDPRAVADALLAVAERPGRAVTVGKREPGGLAAYLPSAATAVIGLGGLALAAGAVALLRRRRRA